MAKAEFAQDYTHRWPSGAETDFPAGWSGTVKQEVLDAATEKGVLVAPKAKASTAKAPARKRGRPPRSASSTPRGTSDIVEPTVLPPADDPAATEAPAPGADGDPIPPNNGVDGTDNSQ